jgi:hypothetical protein
MGHEQTKVVALRLFSIVCKNRSNMPKNPVFKELRSPLILALMMLSGNDRLCHQNVHANTSFS